MTGSNGEFTVGELNLKYSILKDLSIDTYLEFNNKIYHYNVDNWTEPKFKYFYRLFYKEYGKNTEQFGSIQDTMIKDRVQVETTKITYQNKINVIIYSLLDLFKCVNDIIIKTGNNTAVYCMYYSLTKFDKVTYHSIIHTIACEYILKSNLLLEISSIPPLIDRGFEFNAGFKKELL